MTQQFEVGQMVKTKGGYDAEILMTSAPGGFPIVAFVDDRVRTFRHDGTAFAYQKFDLIPPEPKLTGFINVFACEVGGLVWDTREEADKSADSAVADRTHCIDLSDLTEEQLRKWRVED